jgi:hypothetical protein
VAFERDLLPELHRATRAVLACGLVVVAFLGVQARLEAFAHEALGRNDGLYDAGRVLARFDGKGYTLVTTEAGLLPLVSGWRTIDAWGLNDPTIVHHGLTPHYLDGNHPDVIVTHAAYLPGRSRPDHEGLPGWNVMTQELDRYARTRGFVQAAGFGSLSETWNFYVRRDNPDACALVRAIRRVAFVPANHAGAVPDLVGPVRCRSSA